MNLKYLIILLLFSYLFGAKKENLKQKAEIQEKIDNTTMVFSLKMGYDFFFYKAPEYVDTLTATGYASTAINCFSILSSSYFRIPKTAVYQGFEIGAQLLMPIDEKNELSVESTKKYSIASGFVLLINYNIAFRKYQILHTSFSGYHYTFGYFGFGPSVGIYKISQTIYSNLTSTEKESENSTDNASYGLNIFAGYQFSIGKSMFTYGFEAKMVYLFVTPQSENNVTEYISSTDYHQMTVLFNFVFAFQISTKRKNAKYLEKYNTQ